jgi:ParB-like chromosome segregation protein Spo0J
LDVDRDYQLLDDLGPEQFAALKEDIRQRGVLVPIEVTEDGRILDGHQRRRAVAELEAEEGRKVPYLVVVRAGLGEEDRFAHSISMNLQRRQLTLDQKRELAVRLRRRFAWSTAKLGGLLGVHQSTVVRWLDGVEDLPDHVAGEDGRTYRSQIWGGIVADRRDEAAALAAGEVLGARTSTVNIQRALVLKRQAQLDAPYTEVTPSNEGPGDVEIRLGPLDDALADVPSESVDLILTDPPYPQEFLDVWEDLGLFAARTLKPGRLLVAYCGHRWLDECWDRLSYAGLRYAWLGGLWFEGSGPSVHDRRVFSGWRPVLMFSSGEWEPRRWTKDAWVGGGREKDLHPWQQSLDTFLELVEGHSEEGELVVDPFLGSGTTAVAAARMNRRFIGCDVDPGAVATTRRRLGF